MRRTASCGSGPGMWAALLGLLLLLAVCAWAEGQEEDVLQGKLVSTTQNGLLHVQAVCVSKLQGRVSYELQVCKRGAGGVASSRQAGAKLALVGETPLADLRLSVGSKDVLSVVLRLRMDGHVASAELIHP